MEAGFAAGPQLGEPAAYLQPRAARHRRGPHRDGHPLVQGNRCRPGRPEEPQSRPDRVGRDAAAVHYNNLDFTVGMATKYGTGPLTGDDTHLHLAAGYEPGRRFHSAEVIRLADAKKVHLGHVHRADARWRLYAFADAVDPAQPRLPAEQADGLPRRSELARGEVHPEGWDADSVFDVRAVVQQLHLELDWVQMQNVLKPRTGPLGLTDYEKVFCPVAVEDRDIFDRGSGALVVVRPDQYVALTLPWTATTSSTSSSRFMNPA